MWKGLDWQMIAFVASSLYQEYLINVRIPKVYYYEAASRTGKAA